MPVERVTESDVSPYNIENSISAYQLCSMARGNTILQVPLWLLVQ